MLDHGKVVEFGTPWDLLQIDNGSFRDLCRQSGEEAQLFEVRSSWNGQVLESGWQTDIRTPYSSLSLFTMANMIEDQPGRRRARELLGTAHALSDLPA